MSECLVSQAIYFPTRWLQGTIFVCVCVCVSKPAVAVSFLHSIQFFNRFPRLESLALASQFTLFSFAIAPPTHHWILGSSPPPDSEKSKSPREKLRGRPEHEAPERGRAAVGREDGRNYGRESRSRAGGGGGTLPHHRGQAE